MLFEQFESRVPPGSLLVGPLGDAALLGDGSTLLFPRPAEPVIGGSNLLSPGGSGRSDDLQLSQPWRADSQPATRPVPGSSGTTNGAPSSLGADRPAPFASPETGPNGQTVDERFTLPDEQDDPDRIRLRVPPPSSSLTGSSFGHNDPMRQLTRGASEGQAVQAQRISDFGTSLNDSSSGSQPGSLSMPSASWGLPGSGPARAAVPEDSSSAIPADFSRWERLDSVASHDSMPELLSLAEAEASGVGAEAEPSLPASASPSSGLAPSVVPLGFDDGLDGWTVHEFGGSSDGYGRVVSGTTPPGSAVMHEGDSFLVSLQRTITIPDNATSLEFTYSVAFDTDDRDLIKDAFEVALTDLHGFSLVDTFAGPRDAFFNVTEGMSAALGSGATQTMVDQTHQVALDISSIPSGTEAVLTFRLVNNDKDTQTTATLFSAGILSVADPPTVTVGLLNDTAPDGPGSEPYRTDLLTNDPTITGSASGTDGISRLEVQVDDGPLVDISQTLVGDTYTFDPSPLDPGAYRIRVQATDMRGSSNVAILDFRVNQPPVADAGPDRTVDEGSLVTFDASASYDAEDDLFSYVWTFDDGSTAAGMTVSRLYPQDGVFQVTLTVTDTAGSTDSHSLVVTVNNVPPTVDPVPDVVGVEGSPVEH